ncbi:hypothetical protein [Gottschalkia acidurici]|nr:hypothetical protein [Gottschalkia acidurici]
MRGRFISGIVIGATASMVAMTSMSPRQRRRMMKASRRAMSNMIGNIGI